MKVSHGGTLPSLPEEPLAGSGFGEGGGLSRGVTMLGAANWLLCVAASHVICLYSSCAVQCPRLSEGRGMTSP